MPASNLRTTILDLILQRLVEGRACREPACRTACCCRSHARAPRRRRFAVLALLAGLSGGGLSQASAQSWQSRDWRPVFRPTAPQQLALQKISDSTTCLSHLSRLWNAASVYAADNADRLPGDWRALTNAPVSPADFYCPADTAHPAPQSWDQVDFAAISYDLVSPGIRRSAPEQTYLQCRVHENRLTSHGALVEAHPYGQPGQSFPLSGLPTPWLLTAHEAAISVGCMNHLRQIGVSAALFASDNGDTLPRSFADLAGTGLTPAALHCLADVLHPVPVDFSDASATYRLDSPGAQTTDPECRVASCPIHGHFTVVSGTLVQGTNRYPPRLIVGHPLSRTVAPGRTSTLEVLLGDPALGPFSFQWRRQQVFDATGAPFSNTVVIAGATNATFVITNAAPEHEGYYDVLVWDAQGGCQRSHMAYVRVEPLANAAVDPSVACLNNLKGIGLAARLYAASHQDAFPTALAELPPFLGWPLTLFCPTDPRRIAPVSWQGMDFEDTSYTFNAGVWPGGFDVLATCRIHGYSVLADGSVAADPPRLLWPGPPDDAGLRLVIVGLPNTVTVLESSPDLAIWSPVATNTMTSGMVWWTNTIWRAVGAGFFRVRVE